MASTARNTLYLLVAYVFQKAVALFYFILLARYLGVDNFGKYLFAISFATLFSIFIESGLLHVLTREIARDESKKKKYFENAFAFGLLSGIGIFILIAILSNLFNYSILTQALIYLVFLSIWLDQLGWMGYQIFRGLRDLKYESIGLIIHKLSLVGFGLFLIFVKAPIVMMVLPLIVGSLVFFFNAIFWIKKRIGFWPIPRIDKSVLKTLLFLAWPFLLAGIFSKLYATIDTILLSNLVGDQYVGWYGSAQKVSLSLLLIIAGSFGTALYPAFSYYFVRSREKLSELFQQAVFYLLMIAIPISLGLAILSRQVISLIYGQEYLPAVGVLVLLAISIPMVFLDYIFSGLLNACEKQKLHTAIKGVSVGVFIIANLILIPLYKHQGAGMACLISFSFLFILEAWFSRKLVQINKRELFKRIVKILLASMVMARMIYWAQKESGSTSVTNLAILVLVGILTYFSLMFLIKGITKEDLIRLKQIFKKNDLV